MSTQMGQAFLCLLYTGYVTTGNPPECHVWALELLKPLAALLQHLAMPTLVDKGGEISQRCPQREVHENEIVFVRLQGRGVSFWRLQTPEKARAAVSQGVNGIQLCHKLSHQRISERGQHTGDINLSELVHHPVPSLHKLTD